VTGSVLAAAQSVPELINYQGSLEDTGGPMSATVTLTFRFYDVITGGTPLLSLEQTGVVVNEGLFNVLLGSGTLTPGTESTLADVFRKHRDVWMGISVNSDSEMTPRKRIASSPYALMAEQVNTDWLDSYLAQPFYHWTRRMGGSGLDVISHGFCVDGIGNIYITGYFQGTVDFEQDWGGSDFKISAGSDDAFVTKINADGTYGWTYRMGGATYDAGRGVFVDANGDVFVTGNFENTVNFAEDWKETDLKISAGSDDIFVTKINADGTYGWTYRMGDTGTDMAYAFCGDESGKLYITGMFNGILNFADEWGKTDSKTSAGLRDVFLTKLDSLGGYYWTKRIGGSDADEGKAICLDPSGNILLTGTFNDTVDFAADWTGGDSKISAGGEDIFVTKINRDNTYGWTYRIGGTGDDSGEGLCVDTNGKAYVTGTFYNTVDFGEDWGETDSKNSAGLMDAFLTVIESDSTYGWTRRIGSTGNDYGSGICVDGNGTLYLTGAFYETVNFAEDWGGSDNKVSLGLSDVFVTKIKSNDQYAWTRRMGDSVNDFGSVIRVDDDLLVAGTFNGTVNFAEDWGGTDSKTSLGFLDVFVTRIDLR